MANAIEGLEAFIRAWDTKPRVRRGSNDGVGVENVGPDGEINVEASASCKTAVIFVPSDPRFESALEPGVRALCMALIDRLDCVTYSSCQGHRAAETGGRYRRRHVGIVPRNDAEASRLDGALERLCRETNADRPGAKLKVLLVVGKVGGDEREWTCLDLEFFGQDISEDEYFREVEPLTDAFMSKLLMFSG